MTNASIEDRELAEDSALDSDLEAFQFIHEESIKDENIANIIQDLMTMDDGDGKQEPPLKYVQLQNNHQVVDSREHIMISTKPNKIKLSAPQLQFSTSNQNPVKAGKVILAENKQNKPFSTQEFREPIAPAFKQTVISKKSSKITSKNVQSNKNKENNVGVQQQVIKYAKRSTNTITPNYAAVKTTPNQTAVVQSVRKNLNTQQIKQALDQVDNAPTKHNVEATPTCDSIDVANGVKRVAEEGSSADMYIGDWKRMCVAFDHLEENSFNCLDFKVERFMQNLDSWGVTQEVPRPVFDGFSMDCDPLEGIDHHIPQDWKDESVFSEIDRMVMSENVFLHKWLPKCALKLRVNPYRNMLRRLNEKDPYFNITF